MRLGSKRSHPRKSGSARSSQAADAYAEKKRKGKKMKRKIKYTKDMPRLLYTYFATYSSQSGAPSFSKFARSIGATLEDIKRFCKNPQFERAYRECSEIRKDYLIDTALTKRFDPSLVKFLLTSEFGLGEKENEDRELAVTLRVIDGENEA